MTNIFKPDRILAKYQDLDLEELKTAGISHIFMDIDNTLAPYYEKEADDAAKTFISKLKKAGFEIVLVSNNKRQRVERYANSLNLPFRHFALKPLPFTYLDLARKANLAKSQILCMGDQLLTDVIGAKLAGMRVYYTMPLVDKDSFSTKINRKIEKIIMRKYR